MFINIAPVLSSFLIGNYKSLDEERVAFWLALGALFPLLFSSRACSSLVFFLKIGRSLLQFNLSLIWCALDRRRTLSFYVSECYLKGVGVATHTLFTQCKQRYNCISKS